MPLESKYKNDVIIEGNATKINTFTSKKSKRDGVAFDLGTGHLFIHVVCMEPEKGSIPTENGEVQVHGSLGYDRQRKKIMIWADSIKPKNSDDNEPNLPNTDDEDPPF